MDLVIQSWLISSQYRAERLVRYNHWLLLPLLLLLLLTLPVAVRCS
jgi:hypothetical protein